MAAVLLLVFLPGMFAVLFMFGTLAGHVSLINVAGAVTFIGIGVALVIELMRLASGWDHTPKPH